jgi:beta-galactosidase
VIKQTEKYLKDSISFNYYMVHGGTNFAFTAGANYTDEHNIQPDLTSYDYDAPITESGGTTPKYDSIRLLIGHYTKAKLPAVPAPYKTITVSNIRLSGSTDLLSYVDKMTPEEADTPMTFEQLDQGYGYVLYRRKFTQPIDGKLALKGLRDYAVVYVNGKKIGTLNRNTNTYEMPVEVPFNGTLDILVENMGRINYGAEITENTKGIVSPVVIAGQKITGNWQMFRFPMANTPSLNLSMAAKVGRPALYQGLFNLSETGDTFLDMRTWGKGIVFVNGYNLGRYWSVGPQQTLYVPGCWLNKGPNRIVIFEQQNDKVFNTINTVNKPILDQLITN